MTNSPTPSVPQTVAESFFHALYEIRSDDMCDIGRICQETKYERGYDFLDALVRSICKGEVTLDQAERIRDDLENYVIWKN